MPKPASDAEKSRVRDVNDAARLRIFSSLPFTDHKLSLPFTDHHHELSSPIDAGHRSRALSPLRLTKTSSSLSLSSPIDSDLELSHLFVLELRPLFAALSSQAHTLQLSLSSPMPLQVYDSSLVSHPSIGSLISNSLQAQTHSSLSSSDSQAQTLLSSDCCSRSVVIV
ncbi:uncharacterized protein LOC108841462 [Raphanus sativus]|uniref:Uncharacterized protein LOC108841462 n=1 Tax=Raphanus sativus TaxID=3726 RepID=A0A9W3C8X8_RAPSA|nr:uncharacterized protein LOC108841462 [Raphanus sativus]